MITKPDFDILYLYAEVDRYNYQFSSDSAYRIFQYNGWMFRKGSARQNLSHDVKAARFSNDGVILYYDNDSLKITLKPKIDVTYYDQNDIGNFAHGQYYKKLDPAFVNGLQITISEYDYPQDYLEKMGNELVTKILNQKFSTHLKSYQIMKAPFK